MRLFLQNILSSKIWFFVVLLLIVATLVLFLIGFRIVYPLWFFKNDWESISAVGTWFSVVSTTILTVLIIRQTNNNASAQRELEENIAKKQAAHDELNRNISLFDKRFVVYTLLVKFIKDLQFMADTGKEPTKQKELFLAFNNNGQLIKDFMTSELTGNPMTILENTTKNVDILNTSEFLFKTDAGVLIKAFAKSYHALVEKIFHIVVFNEVITFKDELKQAVADHQKLKENNTLEHIKTLLDISSLK